MQTLAKKEMREINGGSISGKVAAGIAISNAAYNFGKGVRDGYQEAQED